MERRKFLKSGLVLGGLISNSNFSLASMQGTEKKPNLLFVFLRGGADGLSMLVPYNDVNYYEKRPSLAIEKSKCIPVNSTFGINPTLTKYVDWYKSNQAIFIPAAGQINNSRSHFQSQDVIEYGINNVIHYKSGFLARLQEVVNGSKSISFTSNLSPIFFSDKITIPNLAVSHLSGNFNFDPIDLKYDGKLKEVFTNVETNIELIKNIKLKESTKLSKIAKFMKSGKFNVGFVDFNDWDTHASQGSLNGNLNQLLFNLNMELESFKESLGEDEWNNTAIVVMSEFGRMLQQNGNGSDHGHGNLISIFGGLITKSQIAGDWLDLKKENLHENRDIPVFYEYRDILSELFIKMYGLNENQIEYIFPENKPTKFNLI